MKPYVQSFQIRWNDLDANRHLSNSSFLSLMTDTRFRFLNEHGMGQEQFQALQLGPVIFSENISYFKEVKAGTTVYVDLELKGVSEDAVFFQFHQHLYNAEGDICAHLEVTAAWFSLVTRKLAVPPDTVKQSIEALPRSSDFKVLTKADTRTADPERMKRRLGIDQR